MCVCVCVCGAPLVVSGSLVLRLSGSLKKSYCEKVDKNENPRKRTFQKDKFRTSGGRQNRKTKNQGKKHFKRTCFAPPGAAKKAKKHTKSPSKISSKARACGVLRVFDDETPRHLGVFFVPGPGLSGKCLRPSQRKGVLGGETPRQLGVL